MNRVANKLKSYWKILGPGLVTGAADDDPSGIATYSQTGAQYGLQLVWMALFTLPLAYVVQEICARIGMVTGEGLGDNIRKTYARPVVYACMILLFAANTFNIGADISAMASGVQLLVPQLNTLVLIFAFALLCLWLQVYLSYPLYSRYLKILALVLLSYIVTGFLVHLNWKDVAFHTVVPALSFSKDQIILVCAILGTTISPYLFFWQSSQEVEEEKEEGRETVAQRKGATAKELKDMRIDVAAGMFISELVMFFIIAVCAATLFAHGVTNIQTAADAAKALRPLAGAWAELLFAVGIIGTGLLSVPVLAGASAYAIAEAFRWREGLAKKFGQAQGFYMVIVVSMLAAVAIDILGIDPIKALLYSAVGNGIVAPVVLFFIMRISSDKKIMGTNANRPMTQVVGWGITAIMAAASITTLIFLFV
ncbi:MAG: natural resistance-associated macrophage protein [Candidatus Kaiserbacteria bacterium]|nr:natural resistance-associated macrophage protein [Candidatus Kaiserbacteria bacterium]